MKYGFILLFILILQGGVKNVKYPRRGQKGKWGWHGTVSRVLNGTANVSPETRMRIEQAMKETELYTK